MTLTLPQELIVEILLRLPVRSLLRFKCVCKSWLSLISDPQFANSHFDLAASPSHRLLLRRTIDDDGFIQSIDLEASLSHNDSSVAALKLRFPPPSSLSPHPEYDVAEILGSCRGLVLFYYYSSTDLILWNPSTGLYNRLPHFGCSFFAKGFHYGFAYDASTDDYVLVFMDSDDAFMDFNDHENGDGGVGWDRQSGVILGHFRTNSWRYTGDIIKFPYVALQRQFRAGSFLNGAFHWMVMSCEKFVPTILAFDFKEETSSEIPLPRHLLVETVHKFYSLIVIGGCLGVCCEVQGQSRDEIWVMKEYKVESSWTKHIVMSTYGIPHNHFTPVYITKDGGILGSNLRRRLEKLNDKGQLLEHLKYVGDDAMYKVNLEMYIESLLSPLSLNGEGNKQL